MKLIAVAVLLTAASVLAPGDKLAFAPKSGSRLTKTMTEVSSWTLESMAQVVDGSKVVLPAPDMHGQTRRKLVVNDTFAKLDGGVPLELQREFDVVEGDFDIEMAMQEQGFEFNVELTSAIDDAEVIFERTSKDAEPSIKRKGAEVGAERILVGLREDTDLRGLLTEEGVEEGDWWKVDVATLRDVLAPGGELLWTPREVNAPPGDALSVANVIGTGLCSVADNGRGWTGEVLCTWSKTISEGDRRVAVIELDWESTGTTDLSDELTRRREAVGDDESAITMNMAWSSKGSGELRWDLGAAHARSFELKLDSDVQVEWREGEVEFRFGLKAENQLSARFETQ